MNKFVIPLNDWAAGERRFRFHADTEFFQRFGNQDILDASVEADISVRKESASKVEADLHLEGTVTVPCDRCLEPVECPVEANPTEVFTPEDSGEDWDLAQVIYDYVCLSLPLQRVHPEGECNPITVRYLGHVERGDEEAGSENSPFAALKGLFKDK